MPKKISELTEEEILEIIESGSRRQVDAVMRYLLATGKITLEPGPGSEDVNGNDDE